RLGDERFFAFFRMIYAKYAFRTFRYADLRRELDAFDPAGGWPEFLDGWLLENRQTDWAVERVDVDPAPGGGPSRRVVVSLRQAGTMEEPTVLLCRCEGAELRVPIWPDRDRYEVPGARVE